MDSHKLREALSNLANKPLAEAIFELRWSLDEVPPSDSIWELLPGLYYNQIRDAYPHLENLPITQVPIQMTSDMVRHRFRTAKDAWPLTQLGPGVLTVNDATSYTVWEDFLPRITQAVNALKAVYPKELHVSRAELRYINAVPFDQRSDTIIDFLTNKLNLRIEPPELFDGEGTTKTADNVNLTLNIPLKKPKGFGAVSVSLGQKADQPSIIFQLRVQSGKSGAPNSPDELETWAGDAHEIIDEWFMTLCDGELLEAFKEGTA